MTSETDDVLHTESDDHTWWTRSNVGEAIPGVPTPLGWTIWVRGGERCPREPFYRIGAASLAERRVPDDLRERAVAIFHGRPALRLSHMTAMGDRIPGTSGAAIARNILGALPAELTARHTRRRYPMIALKYPIAFATTPRQIRAADDETTRWWRRQITRIPGLELQDTISVFRDAAQRFEDNVVLTSTVLVTVLQPIYELLGKLSTASGVCDATELAACLGGTPEAAVVSALWQVSRGNLQVADIQRDFGYHGPREGELSGRVWREDSSPLAAMIAGYAARPDTDDPAALQQAQTHRRIQLEHDILAVTPRTRRPATRLLLRLAASRLPLRGTGKRAFLQSLDIARAAARHAGTLLAEQGRLNDPEDVFYLTTDELTALDINLDTINRRRTQRAEHEKVQIPSEWRGTPEPILVVADETRLLDRVQGIGVSPGTVEGTVQVVTDPSFVDVEPGQVLVASTTDPSWSSIMFLSSALVVDIGGALSHAALVARELGIPCVVNTGNGSRVLRDGDVVRVDGSAGTVEIIERAATRPQQPTTA